MAKKRTLRGTALVTGGAIRIGQAISLKLAALGYNIALHYYHSQQDAVETSKLVRKQGVECELFKYNLEDEKSVTKLTEKVYKAFPNLNVLVNSASIYESSTLKTATTESMDRHWKINLKAPMILMRDFANICQKGHIINVIDANIVRNRTSHFTYLITKKSLLDITKMGALELAPNIRVNGIAPGLILPPASKSNQNYWKRVIESIPLQRKGELDHITQSLEFLLKNDILNGQILFNDGGEHLV